MNAPQRWIALALILLLPFVSVPVWAADSVTLSIASGVSAEDGSYVREGVRLAQDYLWTTFDETLRDPLIVNARDTGSPGGSGIVGMSSRDFIVVFTESEGWRVSAPFDRVHVVVHEVIHVYEHDAEDEMNAVSPAWLLEGLAEYLSYDALAERGLVRMADVDAYNAWYLAKDDSLSSLAGYEALSDYQAADASVYNLAYLATERLLTKSGTASVAVYHREIAGGADWRTAFVDAFGVEVRSFYDEFEEWRANLTAPSHIPQVFQPVVTSTEPSPVRLTSVAPTNVAGDQAVILARTTKGAVCSFGLRTDDGQTTLAQSTFADATGRLFWLVTIPASTDPGNATVSVRCGSSPDTARIEIVAAS